MAGETRGGVDGFSADGILPTLRTKTCSRGPGSLHLEQRFRR